MTAEERRRILAQAHKQLGPNPTREQLHRYNELARETQSQVEWSQE